MIRKIKNAFEAHQITPEKAKSVSAAACDIA